MFRLFILSSVLVFGVNAIPAPFINKCNAEDTKCITASAQATIPLFGAGLPEYNVIKHDKLVLKPVDASVGPLKLIITDSAVTGLDKCKATEISMHGLKINVNLDCDLALKGQYEASGMLTLLPIIGKGEIRIRIKNLLTHVEAELVEIDGKDGKKHWDIKRYTPSFEFRGHSDIELDNLFQGNDVLAQTIKEVLKTSGNDIVKEVGPLIGRVVVKEVAKNINHLFHAVPIDELVNQKK